MTSPLKPLSSTPGEIDNPVCRETSLVFFKYATIILALAAIVYAIVVRLAVPEQTERYVGPVLGFIVAASAWFLLARGRGRAANLVLTLGAWVTVTGASVLFGGVHAPVVVAYPLVITLAGWLISQRAALFITGLSVATIIAFVVADYQGFLPSPPPTQPAMYGVIQVLFALLSAIVVIFLVRSYQSRLRELRAASNDLALRTLDLEASKKELQRAQSVATVGSWIGDLTSGTLRLSAEACRIVGLPEDCVDDHDAYLARTFPDDRQTVDRVWQEARQGVAFDHEHRIVVGADVRWVRRKAEPEFAADGTPCAAVGITQDITERKLAEAALVEREALLQQVLDTSSVAIFLVDMQGRITQANRRMAEMFGRPLEALLGSEYVSLVHPDAREAGRQKMLALLDSKISLVDLDRQYWRADHTEFWGHLTGRRFHDANGNELGLVGVIADINERKQIGEALRVSEERAHSLASMLRLMCDNVPDMIWAKDLESRYLFANKAMCERLLNAADTDEPVNQTDLFFALRERASRPENKQWHTFGELCRDTDGVTLSQGRSTVFEESGYVRGEFLVLDVHKAPFLDENGTIIGTVGSARDITERKQAEKQLHLLASVFTHAREGIMITAPDGTIIDVNEAFTRITGYGRDEVLGRNPRMLNSGRQGKEYFAALWRELIESGHWNGEVWNRRKNGEVYAEMQTISTVRDADGKVQQYVSLFSDITTLKEHEQQLEHIAHYDALTNLPNRVLLADRLLQAMAQAERRGQTLAVAYVDLDGFKAINDQHGHEAGDQLLMILASRMRLALREGDTLARLGGDEFVAVLLDLEDVEASVPMLNRLLSAAAHPVQIGSCLLQVSGSVGVTFYPQAEEVDADQLLRQADQAMYQAKLAGKSRYQIFDTEHDRSIRGHHESVEHMRRALHEREFVLHYQPKVNMRTGAVVGAEALIRWQHPELGLLPPSAFLPVIEDHLLSTEIGEWVIDTALSQMERWQAAGVNLPVSVNIGARQLQQMDFTLRLREILAAHPAIRPGDLELEVLETSALEDLVRVSQVIEDCREIGVTFALDDFGTGYSSLTYLKGLAVGLLKIDQSFVRDMLDDPDDLAILEGVLGLASAFRRQVIAEGVETVEHGEMLLQLGCELAQGFGIARPMPAADLPGWAAAWRPDPAWFGRPSVNRDDLPLLFASVEHRAWIAAVGSHLGSEGKSPPPLNNCHFGSWLEGKGRARHGRHPAFPAVEALHLEVHAEAAALCELQAHMRTADALARLPALHELRDALLVQLKLLLPGNG